MFRLIAAVAITVFAVNTAEAAEGQPPKRPTKIWNRTGPLGETPKRTTDAYPLSDQGNKDGWAKFEPMSDEFDGKELDRNKWVLGIVGWKGRGGDGHAASWGLPGDQVSGVVMRGKGLCLG